jgi:NDP-sugar pyrophosphorylase family protein
MKRRFKTAFILGAGLGTRLRPLTETCPKPLLEIGRRPIITYAMDHLIGVGVDRFIVNTQHHTESYSEKFAEKQWLGFPIIFRHEPILLETAGGLKNIEGHLDDDDAIICYNGDVMSTLPLQRLVDDHEKNRPEATMALRGSGGLLNVNINVHGDIVDLRHTLSNRGSQSCLFTGIYTVETSMLRYIEAGKIESIIPVFLRRVIDKPGAIRGVIIDDGEWNDIGSIDTYVELKTTMGAR